MPRSGRISIQGRSVVARRNKYTVLLRAPDYLSDWPDSQYLVRVETATPVGAAYRARRLAQRDFRRDGDIVHDHSDFHVVLIVEGFVGADVTHKVRA